MVGSGSGHKNARLEPANHAGVKLMLCGPTGFVLMTSHEWFSATTIPDHLMGPTDEEDRGPYLGDELLELLLSDLLP